MFDLDLFYHLASGTLYIAHDLLYGKFQFGSCGFWMGKAKNIAFCSVGILVCYIETQSSLIHISVYIQSFIVTLAKGHSGWILLACFFLATPGGAVGVVVLTCEIPILIESWQKGM